MSLPLLGMVSCRPTSSPLSRALYCEGFRIVNERFGFPPTFPSVEVATQRGDAAAYRTLLAKLVPRLRAYYKRRMMGAGRGAEEAEDLVQETLLAVHLKRDTYDPNALFTPWLHAIARYKLIDHLRSNKMSRMDVPIDDHQELMAADDHASTEGTHDMAKLLGRLPRKTRQAIEAVKLEGKSVAETAARYGMSESNVKISIHRGLKALASFIGRDSDE